MSRVTAEDLQWAFSRYRRALESAGIKRDGHRLELHNGSKSNGTAFGVWWVDEASGGLSEAPGGAFLGYTKSEAYRYLHRSAQTIEDVVYYQKNQ